MKSEKLLDAIGKIDEELVDGAGRSREANMENKKKYRWKMWGALAACLAAAVIIGTYFLLKETSGEGGPEGSQVAEENGMGGDGSGNHAAQVEGTQEATQEESGSGSAEPGENAPENSKPDPETQDLPMIAMGDILNEGMGFEGYQVHDISELVNANPWNEEVELDTLPVYKNPRIYDEHFFVTNPDTDGMTARLLNVAESLGLDTGNLEMGDNAPDAEAEAQIREKLSDEDEEFVEAYLKPTTITAKQGDIELQVDQRMVVDVGIYPAVSLPDEYHFTYDSSYEEIAAAAEYLKGQYRDFLQMAEPRANIEGGDYSYSGKRMHYRLEFFDASGSIEDQIINYNFNKTIFWYDEEGKLGGISVYRPDLSEKAGDYPVISVKEARELLLNGNYITTVPYEVSDEKYIAKVELVYRDDTYSQYHIPYYKFYLELPEEKREHGLKDYGAYYVPAIEGKYISDMPAWDGSFN
ncbi:MAG: hypothetical protein HFI68_04965 [Lachnospiraceae bacterium]|nr:hypothetical protein [Lachnospiraceae bacterium]